MASERVFVSHSHADNAWCDEFVLGLKNTGLDVWYDRAGLYVGNQWIPTIEQELQGRDIFLIVLTPDSWASSWVQRELHLALGQHKHILGVLCKPTQVSGFITSYQLLDATQMEASQAAQSVVGSLEASRSSASALSSSTPSPNRQTHPKKPLLMKRIAVTLAVVIVLVAGGTAAFLTHLPSSSQPSTGPQPVLYVTSDYHVGSTPAGAIGTSFHVIGQEFPSNTSIIFQEDGKTLTTLPSKSSDVFTADLAVTAKWTQGAHLLTAEDAKDHAISNGILVQIVTPGEANTPGPNGAPPDNQSFTINVKVSGHDVDGSNPFTSTFSLSITGRPDPNGGKVCASSDDGKEQTSTATEFTLTSTVTESTTCSGVYKGGHLTYIETMIEYTSTVSQFLGPTSTCAAKTPYTSISLVGNFTSPGHISGQYNEDPTTLNCSDGSVSHYSARTGTFTATLA